MKYLHLHAPPTKVGDPNLLEPRAPGHLGGGRHRSHFDNGALDYLIGEFNVATMLDIGCGLGATVEMAHKRNVSASGIDGDAYCNPEILWDFTKGPCPGLLPVDLAWSMEFLEHVEAEFIPNFMPAFQVGRVVMATFAPPGKPGHHHVNCQPAGYWIDVFGEYGFDLQEAATLAVRAASDPGTVVAAGWLRAGKPFIRDQGLVFVRR